jgi:predicted Zn-ribbon and HTH transcriptional regulator
MRQAGRTTRQRMADRLREEPLAAGALAREFSVTTSDALDHVEHLSKSLEATDEQLLVAPPECEDCGFDDFDDLCNRPSRCPACKSHAVTQPAFTIA